MERNQALTAFIVILDSPAVVLVIKARDNIDKLFKSQNLDLYYDNLYID